MNVKMVNHQKETVDASCTSTATVIIGTDAGPAVADFDLDRLHVHQSDAPQSTHNGHALEIHRNL